MRDDDIIGALDELGYPWTMKCGLMVNNKYRVLIYFTCHGKPGAVREDGSTIYEAVMVALDEFHRIRALYGPHMKPANHIKMKEIIPERGAISIDDLKG
jgi:hypothetical protein